MIDPLSLNPYPLLWIVGKVVNPGFIVNPETDRDIGEEDLLNPDNLPQEKLPTKLPLVETPVV